MYRNHVKTCSVNMTSKTTVRHHFVRIKDFTEEQLNKIILKKLPPGHFDAGRVVPINIKKNMEDPVLPSEDELPSWVFEAIKPDKSLQQLEEEVAKNGLDSLTPYEQKRLKKLRRRQKITKICKKHKHNHSAKTYTIRDGIKLQTLC
jgi:hypothetical protein